jgi:hypothetical protein
MKSLEWLKESLDREMEMLVAGPNLEKLLEPGFVDKRIYAIYLIETYHYTFHNARNQALVATREDVRDVRYMKFCLKHALEEAGHELMAYHDLKKAGYNIELEAIPKPLMATDLLVAYLYRTSTHGNPIARLGYSFWAERIYEYFAPVMGLIGKLGIDKAATTFLTDHSEIDKDHAEQVDRAITMFVKTDTDWQAVHDTMVTSLRLKAKIMDAVFEEFIKLKEGTSTRYSFLK